MWYSAVSCLNSRSPLVHLPNFLLSVVGTAYVEPLLLLSVQLPRILNPTCARRLSLPVLLPMPPCLPLSSPRLQLPPLGFRPSHVDLRVQPSLASLLRARLCPLPLGMLLTCWQLILLPLATHKTPYHHTQHYPPKTQKTKTPQTGHHKSHRLHHNLQGCPSRRPHIQRPHMPSNNKI